MTPVDVNRSILGLDNSFTLAPCHLLGPLPSVSVSPTSLWTFTAKLYFIFFCFIFISFHFRCVCGNFSGFTVLSAYTSRMGTLTKGVDYRVDVFNFVSLLLLL